MAKDQLITWLNDAYAMEQALLPILENHAKDAERDMPQAAARIRQHIDETRHHAERVEQCLKQLGTSHSTMKSAFSSVLGTMQAPSTGLFSDEAVKNGLSDFAAEQFEVACYRALIAAARDIGEAAVARLCEENLREDEAMARWLDEQIPNLVKQTLEKKAAGAKR